MPPAGTERSLVRRILSLKASGYWCIPAQIAPLWLGFSPVGSWCSDFSIPVTSIGNSFAVPYNIGNPYLPAGCLAESAEYLPRLIDHWPIDCSLAAS